MIEIEEPLASWIILVARLCLAGVFLVSGIHKGLWYQKAVQEFEAAGARPVALFVPFTIALHLLAAGALIGGLFVREAALALAVFTVVATLKVHCFWRMGGEQKLARSRIAMAHLAVVGGLILLVVTGPGRLTLQAL